MSCIRSMRVEEKNRIDEDILIIILYRRMDFPGAFSRIELQRGVMWRNSAFLAKRQYRPADLD